LHGFYRGSKSPHRLLYIIFSVGLGENEHASQGSGYTVLVQVKAQPGPVFSYLWFLGKYFAVI
jgi:hypothetical protein